MSSFQLVFEKIMDYIIGAAATKKEFLMSSFQLVFEKIMDYII